MKQHALDDRVGTLAVLRDLAQIGAQHVGQLLDIGLRFRINRQTADNVLQLSDQLGRHAGKIIDEVERVLDLVGDAGGELAERGELLRLYQAVLRVAKVNKRPP